MLSVILKILSLLGILLLCLAGIVLAAVLLVLFFPIFYQLTGVKHTEEQKLAVRANWLLGLLRLSYEYETCGRLKVKLLFFSLYDSDKKITSKKKQKTTKDKGESKSSEKNKAETTAEKKPDKEDKESEEKAEERKQQAVSRTAERKKQHTEDLEEKEKEAQDVPKLFHKIKYTIQNIYDKIKRIWDNISYYADLLREEDTKKMFSDCLLRVGKVWKNIRPRKIRGRILFGTGEPDTTGYLYGIYCIFNGISPSRVLVTPEFMEPVLEGELYVSGHITVFTVLWNGLRLVFDKNIKQFIQKCKAGRKQ